MTKTTLAASPVGTQYYTEISGEIGQMALRFTGLTAAGAVLTPIASWDLGASWQNVPAYPFGSSSSQATISTDGVYRFDIATADRFGVQVTTAGAGTITVYTRSGLQNLLSATPVGSGGSGGSGNTVAATSAGSSASSANPVQGVTGGVPMPVTDTAIASSQAGAGLKTLDPNNAAFTTWPTITATSGTYTTPANTRTLVYNCTVAGNVVMSDGTNSMTVPISVGFASLPFVPVTFTTTATATFYGVR